MLATETSVSGDRVSVRQETKTLLFQALRNAAKVLKLSDGVTATASSMLCFIPKDAEDPISPVQVQRLADERGLNARTVHNHIKVLIKNGLASDHTKDGGGRGLIRSSAGEIVALHGISFQPLFEKADEFEKEVMTINAIASEKAFLRANISKLRKKIRLTIENNSVLESHWQDFETLPRRVAHMTIYELKDFEDRLMDYLDILLTELSDNEVLNSNDVFLSKDSDQSDSKGQRYYNTTDPTEHFSNRQAIKVAKELSESDATSSEHKKRRACGLEHITLDMALQAAPEDWHVWLKHFGGSGWSALANYAYQRGAELGMNASAWKLAEQEIGRGGAALLVLIADVNSVERGGDIQKPGGWIRAMAEKASNGEAHIHRSIFGILNRSDGTLQ